MLRIFSIVCVLGIWSCTKEESRCWECSVVTITNERFTCEDPEKIEELEPRNVEIVCSDADKESYMDQHALQSETLMKECPDGIRPYVVSMSPVCIIVE